MSSSHEPNPERKSGQESTVTIWLPRGLQNAMRETAAQANIAPPLFLRKAIELHQINRSAGPVPATAYPDLEQLRIAFGALQSNPKAKEMYVTQLKAYLEEYEQAYIGQEQGRNPVHGDITIEEVTVPVETADYIDAQVFSLDAAEAYLTGQAFCIAATLELVHLYMELEATTGSGAE